MLQWLCIEISSMPVKTVNQTHDYQPNTRPSNIATPTPHTTVGHHTKAVAASRLVSFQENVSLDGKFAYFYAYVTLFLSRFAFETDTDVSLREFKTNQSLWFYAMKMLFV